MGSGLPRVCAPAKIHNMASWIYGLVGFLVQCMGICIEVKIMDYTYSRCRAPPSRGSNKRVGLEFLLSDARSFVWV